MPLHQAAPKGGLLLGPLIPAGETEILRATHIKPVQLVCMSSRSIEIPSYLSMRISDAMLTAGGYSKVAFTFVTGQRQQEDLRHALHLAPEQAELTFNGCSLQCSALYARAHN